MGKNNPYRKYLDFIPRSKTVNDGQMLVAPVGKYKPNFRGVNDIIGNVAEWTRSDYAPYPYTIKDDRNNENSVNNKVVRGGSWRDKASKISSSTRKHYKPWQNVFNVGFRIIVEDWFWLYKNEYKGFRGDTQNS